MRAMIAVTLVVLGFAAPAYADMTIKDLTKVDTSAVEMRGWIARKAAKRLTLACTTCAGGMVATDILLGSPPDGTGTEERIRSGQTTGATMLNVCKQNAANSKGTECFGVKKADIKGAVGFVTDVSVGPMGFASTYVLWQDGKQLTIRNIAPTRSQAKANGEMIYKAIAPQIVR